MNNDTLKRAWIARKDENHKKVEKVQDKEMRAPTLNTCYWSFESEIIFL